MSENDPILYLCIECTSEVRPRQEALQCEVSTRWQHRTVPATPVSAEYRQAVTTNSDIDWRCNNCTDVYQPDNFGLLPAEYHDQIQNQADQPMQLVPYSDSHMSISLDESPTRPTGPAPTDSTPVRQHIFSPATSPSSLHILASPQLSPDRPVRRPLLFSDSDSDTDHNIVRQRSRPRAINYSDTDDDPDITFDISNRSFQIPDHFQKDSLSDSSVDDPLEGVNQCDPTTYQMLQQGFKRGNKKLFSSDRFSYTVKRQKDNKMWWWCSVRGKNSRCPATVNQ